MAKKQKVKTKKPMPQKSQRSMIITIISLVVIVGIILLMVATTLKENMDNKSSADGGRRQECQIDATASVTSAKKVKTIKCQESVDLGYYIDLSNFRQLYCTSPAYPIAKGCSYTNVTQ